MKIKKEIPLNAYSTFKLGGNAKHFVSIKSANDIKKAILWSKSVGLPYFIIGEGSNILFSDEGFNGLIIKNEIKGLEYYEKDGSIHASVGAGENWDEFVSRTVNKGLYGIENLSGIPGSVGATPIQNVGAYGTEVGDVISWVEVFNPESMNTELLSNEQCKFSYRDSFFKSSHGKNLIITEVGFRLDDRRTPKISYRDLIEYFNLANQRPTLKNIREAVIYIRSNKFPDLNEIGCGGSFFKNPIITIEQFEKIKEKHPNMPNFAHGDGKVKIPLAWILENVTMWKGIRRGAVGVYEKQPLVLVNFGNGTSKKIKELADDIIFNVSKETNILISPEVSIIGEF